MTSTAPSPRGLGALAAVFACCCAFAVPAAAAPDAAAAEKLAKASGCTKCHAADKSKKGPSYQKTAAKFRGKSDAEEKLITHLTTSPRVKFPDGTEEEHDTVDTKDAAQIRNLVQWILAQ
ncbi:c-type cytochrome [Aquabacterium humicola]|uniref:c-type cytochrome n=1 Tax=Aquabacterium humicola TaxID=3237377 RepID=UPI002543885E|nr:c-type cytochrome [Rubrivivax pictus]